MNDSHSHLYQGDLTYDYESRLSKAKKILAVCQDFDKKSLDQRICLDMGSGAGIITDFLANYFRACYGVDVDAEAIEKAKSKPHTKANFLISRKGEIPFSDGSIDVVICNQVYEHASDPYLLVSEIKRVLKKGGYCYFGARNKYFPMDGHYKIPFIAWFPKRIANLLIRIVNRSYYDISLLSLNSLNNLVKGFEKTDFTLKVIEHPNQFKLGIPKQITFLTGLLVVCARLGYTFIPNYIWILKKVN